MSHLFNRGADHSTAALLLPLWNLAFLSKSSDILPSLPLKLGSLFEPHRFHLYTRTPLGSLELRTLSIGSNSKCFRQTPTPTASGSLLLPPLKHCCRQRAVMGRIRAGGVVEGGAEGARSHGLDVWQFWRLRQQPNTQRHAFVATIMIIKHRTEDEVNGERL